MTYLIPKVPLRSYTSSKSVQCPEFMDVWQGPEEPQPLSAYCVLNATCSEMMPQAQASRTRDRPGPPAATALYDQRSRQERQWRLPGRPGGFSKATLS